MTRTRTVGLALAVAFVAFSSGGCQDKINTLDGSLSEVYDIHFEHVRARLYSSELAIEYVDVSGAVPVRVTLRLKDATALPDHRYDLVQVGDVSGRADNDAEIPRFSEGKLDIVQFPIPLEAGGYVSGDFSAKFATSRDALGLDGDFGIELEIVDRTPGN